LGKKVVTPEVAVEVCLTLSLRSLLHVGARLVHQSLWHSEKISTNTHIFVAMLALPCGMHVRRVVLRHLFSAPWSPRLLYWQAKESTSCLLAFHRHLRPERESVAHTALIQTFRRRHDHVHLEFSSIQPWLVFACTRVMV